MSQQSETIFVPVRPTARQRRALIALHRAVVEYMEDEDDCPFCSWRGPLRYPRPHDGHCPMLLFGDVRRGDALATVYGWLRGCWDCHFCGWEAGSHRADLGNPCPMTVVAGTGLVIKEVKRESRKGIQERG